MEKISAAVRGRGIAVIEDAAQSLGAQYKDGRGAGSLGDYGCFSFFPSKNLGAMGDAGMVSVGDDALADKLKLLRGHGAVRKYYHSLIGGNFRIDTIQAAVLAVKLKYLDGWTAARQENARRYDKMFSDAGLVSSGAVIPPEAVYKRDGGPERYHIYNQYMIRARHRDDLKKFLDTAEVGNDIYYPLPFHLQECFASLGGKKGDFPQSDSAAAEVLALPVYPELKPEMQEYVVSKIKEFYKTRG
jgi:dTDP-4-amino-4,6-dideoxygalactose transaminase